jgi:hypothetical protein
MLYGMDDAHADHVWSTDMTYVVTFFIDLERDLLLGRLQAGEPLPQGCA